MMTGTALVGEAVRLSLHFFFFFFFNNQLFVMAAYGLCESCSKIDFVKLISESPADWIRAESQPRDTERGHDGGREVLGETGDDDNLDLTSRPRKWVTAIRAQLRGVCVSQNVRIIFRYT
jgi:hypothetical protein